MVVSLLFIKYLCARVQNRYAQSLSVIKSSIQASFLQTSSNAGLLEWYLNYGYSGRHFALPADKDDIQDGRITLKIAISENWILDVDTILTIT